MIRVLLADGHPIIREGIAALFGREEDIVLVACAQDGDEAVELVRRHEPDVALLDVSLPRVSGVEALRRIREAGLSTRCVLVSMQEETSFVRAAAEADAAGYVLKRASFVDLLAAVRAVARGERFFSPSALVVADEEAKSASSPSKLTPRERDVLRLVASGLPSKQIAGLLGISVRTVDGFRVKIMNKVGVRTVAGLVKYSIRSLILPVD